MSTVTHTKQFTVDSPIDDVFPLFSPEGEKAWVPGWDYENIMGTTALSEDYVFVTNAHDHATTDAVWLVKHFDPVAHSVAFYKVEPGEKVGVVTVKCQSASGTATTVSVTYKYTSLSPSGEEFVKSFTPEHYDAFIGEWESLLAKYFASR